MCFFLLRNCLIFLSLTVASRTADSIRRQAQRELEQEKALEEQMQRALDLKEHYFGTQQVDPLLINPFLCVLLCR